MSVIRTVVISAALLVSLAGCGPSKPAEDPHLGGLGPDLHEVAKSRGKRLEYKAGRPGKLYLYDYDTSQFLYSGQIKSGETFVLEPASNRALLGTQPLDLDYPANAFDDYRLYLADQ